MARSGSATLCVDLGKTSCRVALMDATGILAIQIGEGLPGATAPDAAQSIARRVVTLAAALPSAQRDRVAAVGAGVAGALADPEAAQGVADALAEALYLPVAVSSDIVTAHIGALGGGPGITLVAGTGAVALGVDDAGSGRLVDGWGPDLGDLGSGAWIGREGVRATLRSSVGISGPTALTEVLSRLTGGADPVRWISAVDDRVRALASFAPSVLDLAAAGDPQALDIAARAVTHLTETARAATPQDDQRHVVAVLGGLTGHAWFARRLASSLAAVGLDHAQPRGTALDGAHATATRSDLPHERYIHRAQ